MLSGTESHNKQAKNFSERANSRRWEEALSQVRKVPAGLRGIEQKAFGGMALRMGVCESFRVDPFCFEILPIDEPTLK
ncbi:hypothetical protein CEXT_8631 [Caerostris extrusa]|uniref:Uncharacterized protein n=1 Tax=Caerostris extrusa TaxID=172846 RepID=A0AAV4UWK8_CAEEX|nr:hypothetical protein CEXT_8631 [Caerostris extrusa]